MTSPARIAYALTALVNVVREDYQNLGAEGQAILMESLLKDMIVVLQRKVKCHGEMQIETGQDDKGDCTISMNCPVCGKTLTLRDQNTLKKDKEMAS